MFLSNAKKILGETDYLSLSFLKYRLSFLKYIPIKLEPSSAAIPVTSNTVIPYNLTMNVSNNTPIQNYSLPLKENFYDNVSGKIVPGTSILNPYILHLQVNESPDTLQQITTYLSSPSHIILTISIPIIVTAGVTLAILRVVDINKSAVIGKLRIANVIQVDGTVIVGVLVLLSLGSTINTGGFHRTSLVVGVVTASIVCPFALSAMIVTTKGTVEHGIKLTFSGFVYLMAAVILLSLIQ
jgi:hypothetical protein